MRYSKLFGKTQKQISKEIESKSHQLLVKAGFVDQLAAGIYTWLPLGKKSLSKIDEIIRTQMNAIGGQEITMPILHPKKNWVQTGRWDSVDILFKLKSTHGAQYALGPTHEEVITPLVAKYINSYKDLPIFLYQIQTKLRDEPRAKSGVIRGREFGMKDMYSFHTDQKDLASFYQKVIDAYLNIFSQCGLEAKVTEASGGEFTKKYSHEFLVISPAGEDTVIYCPNCTFAQNKEISKFKATDPCPKCSGELAADKAIEVGNIFDLETKFSKDFNLTYLDKSGKKEYVYMGCYGLGDTRLVGAIVENNHDELGIIWPEKIAPYKLHLISISSRKIDQKIRENKNTSNLENPAKVAEDLYKDLTLNNIEVLFDDRKDTTPGQKLVDADLIGCPYKLVISQKSLSAGGFELTKRGQNESKIVTRDQLLETLL